MFRLSCIFVFVAIAISDLSFTQQLVGQQEDRVITRVVPKNCTFFAGWTGELNVDAKGAASERWLAQPEIQVSVAQLKGAIEGFLDANSIGHPIADEAIRELPWLMMRNSFSVYVTDVEFNSAAPVARIGLVIELGDQENWMSELIDKSVKKIAASDDQSIKIELRTIDGGQFYRIKEEDAPLEFHFGIVDGYLAMTMGTGAIEQLLANLKTPEPSWIKEVHAELPTERLAGIFRVNMADFWEMAETEGSPLPEFLHLDDIRDVFGVMGIQDGDMVTSMAIQCSKLTDGILSVLDTGPLKLDHISEIPEDVVSATGVRLSIDKVWQLIKQGVDEFGGDQITKLVNIVEEDTGLDFEREILGSFEGTVYNYGKIDLMNPTGGALASLRIREPTVFEKRLKDINDAIKDELEFRGSGKFDEKESGGSTIYSMTKGPITICWCHVGEQLFVSMDAGAIRSHLRKRKRSSGKLIDVQRFKDIAISNGQDANALVAVSFTDVGNAIQLILPILGAAVGNATPHPDFDFSFRDIPPAKVLTKDIKTNVAAIYRTDKGFRTIERHTIPGNSSIAAGGVLVGMLLPAVQSVRHAARRTASMNNVRQLILSLLNYESDHGSFPPSYTMNEDGEKLLSWRVHILPYLEENELYKKFHLDEPWDSLHNKQLIAQMPETFVNPALALDNGMTSYLGITGEDGILVAPMKSSENGKMNMGVTFEQIMDGSSNTILIVDANQDSAVTWTKPTDFDAAANGDIRSRLEGTWPENRIIVGCCDGSCHSLDQKMTSEQIKMMMSKSGGEIVDFDN